MTAPDIPDWSTQVGNADLLLDGGRVLAPGANAVYAVSQYQSLFLFVSPAVPAPVLNYGFAIDAAGASTLNSDAIWGSSAFSWAAVLTVIGPYVKITNSTAGNQTYSLYGSNHVNPQGRILTSSGINGGLRTTINTPGAGTTVTVPVGFFQGQTWMRVARSPATATGTFQILTPNATITLADTFEFQATGSGQAVSKMVGIPASTYQLQVVQTSAAAATWTIDMAAAGVPF